MDKQELLRSVPIFSRLNDEHLRILVGSLGTCTFERGDAIVRQGDVGDKLYIIVSGQVRIFTINEAGQELSLIIYRPGDFLGELSLLDGQPRSASAEAMRRTTTLTLHRAAFLSTLYANPHMAAVVMEALAARLRHSTLYAQLLASHSAPQRIVGQLLDLAARYGVADGGAVSIDLHLTQDDLASLSGTTRETVNRVLSSLRDQGLVRVERARVIVLNLDQLEQSLAQLRASQNQ
jgi:CRP/FNR family transcriptional regulator, cyclic AMP receptor protein